MDTFGWYFQLSALDNLYGLAWLVSWALWYILDLLDDIVALEDLAENNVLAIQPTSTISFIH